jgi:hypothetical protein
MILTLLAASLLPIDEAKRDASLVAFRSNLLQIVARRDRQALLRHVAPDIRTSFGDGGGRRDFERQWKLNSKTSPLWKELGSILRLGGGFQGQGFWAPYVFAKWPEKYDPFEHFAVVTPNEPLRRGGRTVASLKYAIVRGLPDRAPKGYRSVQVVDGAKGQVREAALRSPIGWRAAMEKRGGKWMLTALVAGD